MSLFSFITDLFENVMLMELLIVFTDEFVIGGAFIAIMFNWQVFPPHNSSLGRVITALVVSRLGLVI